MSDQRISVSLAFSADTSKVRAQLQELQTSLQNIVKSTSNIGTGNLTKGLNEGVKAAAELQAHLQKATNTKTGTLDFTTLNNSIKASGTSLQDYGNKLKSMGPSGEAAFKQLTQAVANSEVRIKGTHKTLDKLWDTMKKTMGWHISSSVINNFSKGLSSAYGYAQDLNRSLNDIRIVTGQSSDQMAKFAEQANKSAKELSTTTTAYTDAALIFYQQGLEGDAVTERTDAVVKMSNVTGESAAEVSSYMTAVWNNFYDGSKSLEYYADVMTELGAATASSTDEIAAGLEKFASIGDTVGLSYEYATSALATVVAETRQSADTVGTAFKTIFARLQGLQLGETAEDGTDLNKYSAALAKVGVQIKDEAGNMKEMDQILEDLGSRWGSLAKDQQMALAQTVAGTRQYTQLISLMDNWSTFQQNLTTAQTAEGSLQEQADIYAESWQAASKRVKAAAEGIFQDLLNDDFFIDLLNMAEGFLNLLNQIIDSMGGLPGLLSTIGALMTKIFGQQISQSLTKMGQELSLMTKKGRENQFAERNRVIQSGIDYYKNEANPGSGVATSSHAKNMEINLTLQKEMLDNVEKMSDIEKMVNQSLLERQGILANLAEQEGKKLDEARDKALTSRNQMDVDAMGYIQEINDGDEETEKKDFNLYEENREAFAKSINLEVQVDEELKNVIKDLENIDKETKTATTSLSKSEKTMKRLSKAAKELGNEELNNMVEDLKNSDKSGEEYRKELVKIKKEIERIQKQAKKGMGDFVDLKQVDQYGEDLKDVAIKTNGLEDANENFANGAEELQANLKAAKGAQKSWSDTLVSSADGVMSLTSGLTSLYSIVSTLSNPDLSGWEKFSSVLMSLGMGLPMVISGYGTLKTQLAGLNTSIITTIASQTLLNSKYGEEIGQKIVLIAMNKALTKEEQIAQIMDLAGIGQKEAEIALENGLIAAKGKNTAATLLYSAAAKLASVFGITLAGAKTTETGAVVANTAAWYANPIMWIALVIAAVVAALVGLIAAIMAVSSALSESKAEKNLEAAKEKSETLGKQLEETRKRADELKESFNNYSSIVDELDKCAKGTEEWKEKLKEANDVALETLQNYPQLYSMTNEKGEKAVSRNEDGLIEIADWAMEDAQTGVDNQVTALTGAKLQADAQVREAQIEVDRENLQISSILDEQGEIHNVSDFVKDNAEALGRMTEDEQRAFIKQEKPTLDDIATNNLIEELKKLGPELSALADSVDANTDATEVENQNMADSILVNNEKVQSSGYADELSQGASGKLYDLEVEKQKKKLEDDGWGTDGISKASGANPKAKEVFGEYAKAVGLENYELTDTTGTDDNRKFVYEIDGVEQEPLSLETMKEAVAAFNSLDGVNASAEELIKTFAELESTGTSYDKAMKDFLSSGDLSNATFDEAQDLITQTDTSGDNIVDDSEAEAYLDKKFGDGEDGTISNDTAKKYGYDTAAEMVEAYKTGLNDINTAWGDMSKNMSLEAKQAYDNLDVSEELKGLSLNQAKTVSNSIQTAFEIGGSEGVAKMSEYFSRTGKDADEFADVLNDVDWSTVSVNELSAKLKEAEVATEYTNEELANMIELMGQTSMGLEGASQSYSDLQSIAKDLKVGDTISEEDYDKLGAGYEDYFTLMADGTYKLVGDAESFYEAVNQQSIQGFIDNIEDLQKHNAGIDNLIENYDTTSIQGKATTGDGTTDAGKAQAQIDYLKIAGYDDTKALAEWQEGITKGTLSTEQLQAMADAVRENAISWDSVTEAQRLNNEQIQQNIQSLLNSARSLDELQALNAEYNLNEDGPKNYELYAQALINLASQYENTADEIEEFNQALQSGNAATIKAAEEALELATMVGEMAEAYELDAKETENYAKRLSKSMGISEKAAVKAAVANQRLDKGLLNLNENLEDYQKALKKNSKNTAEWSKTMDAIKTDLADILNVTDGTMLSDQFAEDALASEDLKLALDGDTEAIKRLKLEAADDIVLNIVANQDTIQPERIVYLWDQVKYWLENTDISAPEVDQTNLINSFNELIEKGNMTKEQIESTLAGLHVSANVKTTYVPQTVTVPQTITEEFIQNNGKGVVNVPGPDGKWEEQEFTLKKKVTRTYDAGTAEVQGVVPKYEIEGTEGEGGVTTAFSPAPTIAPSYSSTTSGVNNSSSNGGGNSSSKPKTTEKKEAPDTTPHEKLIKSIDSLTRKYDKASQASDRFYGKKRVNSLKEEAKYAGQLADKYKTLAKAYGTDIKNMLSKEQDTDKKTGKTSNLSKGLFDTKIDTNDDGYILNENALKLEATRDYNISVEKYNQNMKAAAAIKDEAARKKAEENVEKDLELAEKKYDNQMDWLDKYAEAVDNKLDAEEQAAEQRLLKWQKKLEAITYTVEVQVELNEEDIDDIERELENIQGQKAVGKKYYSKQVELYEDEAGEELQNIAANNKGISAIYQRAGLDKKTANQLASGKITQKDLDKKQKKALNKYFSENIDDVDALKDFLDANEESAQRVYEIYHDNIPEVLDLFFEDMSEGLEEGMEGFDRLTESVEILNEVIDITGRKILGIDSETILNNANTQWEIAKNKYKASVANAEKTAKIYENLNNELKLNPELINDRDWAEVYKTAKQTAEDGAAAVQESLIGAIEAAENAFQLTVTETLATLSDGLGGVYKSLEDMRDAYEKSNTLEEMYLKDYAKTYNLTKLTRDISKSIENSSNIRGQQKLNDLLEEANEYMRQGVEMSQADFDYLQKKYDLRLAEIALEEAQNAKKSVRLTQDSEGNWGYVYSADSAAIDSAQQAYDDKLYELQKFAEETEKTLTDQYLKAWEDCYAEMEQLQVSDFENQEEYTKALMDIYDHYAKVAGNSLSELNGLYAENAEINAEYGTVMNEAFSQGDLASIYGVSNISQLMSLTEGEVFGAISDLGTAFTERKNRLDKVLKLSGEESWENLLSDTKSVNEELKKLNNQFKSDGTFWTEYKKYFNQLLNELKTANSNYNKNVTKTTENSNQSSETGEGLIDEASGFDQGEGNGNKGNNNDSKDNNKGNDEKKNNDIIKASLKKGAVVWKITDKGLKETTFEKSKEGTYLNKNKLGKNIDGLPDRVDNAKFYKFKIGDNKYWVRYNQLSEKAQKKMSSFDTGGYTGEWDSSGKLAMLHQKEIVLNAHDTANLLETVGLVRELASKLDLTALAKQFNLNSSNTTGFSNKEEQVVQQEVHITAEFPGVTDRYEIEEAFNNLVNRVSQYTNKLY